MKRCSRAVQLAVMYRHDKDTPFLALSTSEQHIGGYARNLAPRMQTGGDP